MRKALALTVFLLILLSSTAIATSSTKQINVEYGISVSINGQPFTPKDINGKVVEPFVYNGTTYAPIRAITDAMGATIGYDEKSNSVTINSNNGDFALYYSLLEDERFTRECYRYSDLLNDTLSNMEYYMSKSTDYSYIQRALDYIDGANAIYEELKAYNIDDKEYFNNALDKFFIQKTMYCDAMYYFKEYKTYRSQENYNSFYNSATAELSCCGDLWDYLDKHFDYIDVFLEK